MTGKFFSGPGADEAILQIEFARQLLRNRDLTRKRLGAALCGTPIAECRSGSRRSRAIHKIRRKPLPADFRWFRAKRNCGSWESLKRNPRADSGALAAGAFSIPLQVAEKLRVAQTNDFRTMLGARPGRNAYQSLTVRVKSPALVKDVEDSIKTLGFATFSLLDAANNLRQVFAVFDLLMGILAAWH